MKKLLLFGLTALILSVTGAEIRFKKQLLPRANEIVIGKTHISVMRDTTVPSGWTITASNEGETRKYPLILNGVNRIIFPGVILEMQNWNVSKNESWNIMAENIGTFEIRELTPAEVVKQESAKVRTEKRRPGEVVILTNKNVTLETYPAANGVVPGIYSNVTGQNLAHVGNLNRDLTLKDFTGVGFVELFNFYGNTTMTALDWKFNNGVLKLSGESAAAKNVTFYRDMELFDSSFAFKFASGVKGSGNLPKVKHRPEMRIPGSFGSNALSMFLPRNGRLYPRNVQTGSYTLDGTSYALGDKESGLMLGVYYRNVSEIYLFIAENYMTLEATGIIPENNIAVPPLTVTYFLVHGLSRADFIGEGVLLAIPEKTPVGMIGKKIPLTFTLGNAIPLKQPHLQFEYLDEKGNIVQKQNKQIPAAVAGFASKFTVDTAVDKLKSGRYTIRVSLFDEGKKLLQGEFILQLLSETELQKAKDYLKVLDQRIEAIRKRKVTSAERKKQMTDFKKALLLRKEYLKALDSGDMKRIIDIQNSH